MEKLSSPWIAEFSKQRQHGQHSIIYGNIYDQIIYRNNALTIEEFLNDYFQDANFEIIVSYSQLEGYKFKGKNNGKTSYEEFYNILKPNGPVKSYDPNKIIRVDKHDIAIADICKVLAQNRKASAAIINLGDLLTSQADHYTSEERTLLAVLKKATLKASLVPSNKETRRNTLIILGSDLKRIPEWVYLNNPYVGLVQVSLPSQDIRRHYTERILKNFYQDQSLTQNSNYESIVTNELADLTEGFRLFDIRSLTFTSNKHKIPLKPRNIWRLVDCYKFGKRADPWEALDLAKVENAQEMLSSRVIGQQKAVTTVTDILVRAKIGVTMDPEGSTGSRPKGVFFFVGPTGVGKTELAKALSQLVFGDEKAFTRFDMSEYKEQHAAEKLAGSPPGFVGYSEGGQLTNRVLENPYCILLFDEIEKAHPTVMDKFLQILEDGRLTDGKGQTAYFNQSIIIFTSNIGASSLLKTTDNLSQKNYEDIEDFFLSKVREYFLEKSRAEILNRLGENVVVFDILRSEHIQAISHKFLSYLQQSAFNKYKIELVFDESINHCLTQEMQKADNFLMGGRKIKNLLEKYVERPLNYWIFQKLDDLPNLANSKWTLSIDRQLKLLITPFLTK